MNKVTIIDMDHQGRGIAKDNNKIIFIPNTLIDEIVEYKITKSKKNYCEGQVINFIKKSPNRIKESCSYNCGGCDLLHMNYSDQLDYKQKKIENIMKKFTGLDLKINKIIPSDETFYYRNKVTFHIDKKIGLFKKKTNEIVEIDKCLLADKKINQILIELKKLNINSVKQIVIKASSSETMVYYDGNINNIETISATTIVNNNKVIKGNGYITEKLKNLKFIISPESFFQINTKQTIKLYDKVKEFANLTTNENLLDLYCGTGTIGLYLSDKCNQVLGVEINNDAIKDANQNKEINNISNATFILGDAKDVIKKTNFKPDIIVVDPPRSGLFKGMVSDIVSFNAKKLIYVSCDPITLARDLKELNEYYNIVEIQPIDLFPNTYHIECIVLLNIKVLKN